MASNWVRGAAERPPQRRIILVYKTADPNNAGLEQLMDRIPYGQGNRILLECLRTGANALVRQAVETRPEVGAAQTAAPGQFPHDATAPGPEGGAGRGPAPTR